MASHIQFILIFLLLLLFVIGCDVRTMQFESYEDLISSELHQKGWIPMNVPREISDITVKWDIDTNDTWIKATVLNYNDSQLQLGESVKCPKHILDRAFRYSIRKSMDQGVLYRLNNSTIIFIHGDEIKSVLIYSAPSVRIHVAPIELESMRGRRGMAYQ